MLYYVSVGFVLFPFMRFANLGIVTRVREARFHAHRFTNVRFMVSVGSGLDLE